MQQKCQKIYGLMQASAKQYMPRLATHKQDFGFGVSILGTQN